MSILIDSETRVLVQGITGHQASIETQAMVEYGTQVVAGCSPGRGGQERNVCGVPVYDTVRDAAMEHSFNASIVYVPPQSVKEAVLEAISSRVALVVVPTERVPIHDMAYLLAASREAGCRIIGPNSQGIMVPSKARIGGLGGSIPESMFAVGRVGVVSRSGGMAGEISWLLKRHGMGTSTQVHIGGEPLLGSTFRDVLRMFEDDPDTDGVCLFGERGGVNEQDAAEGIASGEFNKPIAAFVAGSSFDSDLQEVRFGHGGNLLRNGMGRVAEKVQALSQAGVIIADAVSDLPRIIGSAITHSNVRVTR